MERKRGARSPNQSQTDKKADKKAAKARSSDLRKWRAADLLGDAREAIIEHGSEFYRLRLTSNNKLILTK